MKAARSLLAWSQEALAEASGVSIPTIKRLEAADGDLGGRSATGEKIVSTLEDAGVDFIPENGGGAGVRLRKPSVGGDHARPALTNGLEEIAQNSIKRSAMARISRGDDDVAALAEAISTSKAAIRASEKKLGQPSLATDHPKPSGPATDVIERMEAEIAADRQSRKR